MPPRKRKAQDTDSEQEPSQASTSTKKLKKSGTLDSLPHNGQPTNRVLPSKIQFEKRAEGTLRIATWNVCGFAASSKKGFKFYVEAEDADILVLTETKVSDKPTDPALMARYPHQYWIAGEKKGHGGTAILSKVEPLKVDFKLPGYAAAKGRIVTLEYSNCYLIGTYVVNAGMDLKNLGEKAKWMTQLDAYLRDLDTKKPVIWTGDINIAPTAIDLQNSKKAWNKQPGYTEVETSAFKKLLANPADVESPQFVDVWRHLYPAKQNYTYWSYRFQSREKGNGWRLDMFILSNRIVERVKQCVIRDEIYGASDHAPIIMDINAEAVTGQ